jgi:catechol 2,3-dioxygenase-like lactoylglutathione lyase family enzyme
VTPHQPTAPPVTGLLETGLYVDDVARSRAFYTRLFGFPVLVEDDRLCALDVRGRAVLLLFRKGGTTETVHIPGGAIPGHDGHGTLHYAFAIAAVDLEAWLRRLEAEEVPVESRVAWPRGGISLYFRDPDQHLVELATPGVWATY